MATQTQTVSPVPLGPQDTLKDTTIPGLDVNEDFIRTALTQADVNSLRMALYQITQDEELGTMQVTKADFRGGAVVDYVVSKEDQDIVRAKALKYFSSGPQNIPTPPSKEDTFKLMDMFSDVPMDSDKAPSFNYEEGYEELAFDDFPRDVEWSTGVPPMEKLKDFKILVVGAGISGIAASIYLKRAGIPFEVIEHQDSIGGVWNQNSYPHVRVDSPFSGFQYKFVKDYRWKEHFPAGAKIREYLLHVAQKFDILEHMRFNREVVAAKWDAATSQWIMTTRHKDGTEEVQHCNVVFSAAGLFNAPNLPDIPGIESYKRPIFHTSRFDHSVDMKGKRVALIGTGSTGTQVAPALAEVAQHLSVYQRTAGWIAPFPFFRSPVSANLNWVFTHMPFYWNWHCYSSFVKSLNFFSLQEFDDDWKAKGGAINERNDNVRRALTEYVTECFKDRPDLLEKMMPNHAPMVRRMAVDNGFYDTVKQDHVDLITTGIERITETGIKTKDGEERKFDVILLGAGFKVSQYLWPVEYLGTEGMTLQKLWEKDGARSYLGMTMPNYPNLFMFYGPNHQPRAGSVHSMAELWARYSVSSVIAMIEKDAKSMEVKREVFDDYNVRLDRQNKGLIWESEGYGYLVNKHGRQGVNMPWTNGVYHLMVQKPNLNDFVFK